MYPYGEPEIREKTALPTNSYVQKLQHPPTTVEDEHPVKISTVYPHD